VKTRVPKRVVSRRNLSKFGDARLGEENVTLLSKDFVLMEHPEDQLIEDNDDPNLKNSLQSFAMKQQERAMNRELDSIDEETDMPIVDIPEVKTSGNYIPPNQRGKTGVTSGITMLNNSSEENTLRVSNLTKNVTEEDLRELFGIFGGVQRVHLPRTERTEGNRTIREPKGYSFIAFANHDQAEAAMERLNGHGYDHLILKVEWALPNKEGPGNSGGLSGGYVSGYGKQLAQDTKERVSYASNLTGNKP
jgi:hypothetical protein